jgi:7-cyano-7-deazaguanine synthase
MKKAIILFSGGLDSTTCLALAKSEGFECHALSFNYGQKNIAELNAAKKIAAHFNVPHLITDIPSKQFKGSPLTDTQINIPDYNESKEVSNIYVPARNTIFLSFALAFAEVLKANDIFFSIYHPAYPDCTPEYIQTFEKLANLGTQFGIEDGNIKIQTPFMFFTKAETIKLGLKLGVNYEMTVTCYRATPEGLACGKCQSCILRKKGFEEASSPDRTLYTSS